MISIVKMEGRFFTRTVPQYVYAYTYGLSQLLMFNILPLFQTYICYNLNTTFTYTGLQQLSYRIVSFRFKLHNLKVCRILY